MGSGPDRATPASAEDVDGSLLTARRHRQGVEPETTEPIEQCITYLTNHASYLNYPHYLAKGIPSHGRDRGACRYVVKDRMEITGARWGLEGGEAVLKLRALYLNGISMRTGNSTNNRNINAITSQICRDAKVRPTCGHPYRKRLMALLDLI